MPAYNAARTLLKTYEEIPRNIVDQIILVDDHSQDQTVEIAEKLDLLIIEHDQNLGYGANQKTCYQKALELEADIIIMLHPDYQHDPKLIKPMVKKIIKENFDLVLGSRFLNTNPLKKGMPKYKYLANRFLSFGANKILGLNLSEYHTGYRVFSAKVLKNIDFQKLDNGFIFDFQILIQAHKQKFKIAEISCPARYQKESSSIGFWQSLIYGFQVLLFLIKYNNKV